VYVALAVVVFWFDVGDAGVAPVWVVVVVPAIYGALSFVLLRRASITRRIGWVGGACLTHVALGVAAAAVCWLVADATAMAALAHALARLGPVPALTLVATPVVLAPFGGRVLSARPAPRPVRQPPVTPLGAVPAETPFARDARRGDARPDTTPVQAAPPPSPERVIASAAPVDTPDASGGDDAVVRVRFERVAEQLPSAAFTLPLDRVAESLREPHWLTVPRRIVVTQLPEGAVQVDWSVVASQFPALAFAMSDVEFRQKYPGLKLTLPLEDVLRQLPSGIFSIEPAPNQIAGLDAFPPPFQPLPVPRDEPPSAAAPSVANVADAPQLPPGIVMATPPAPAAPAPPAPVAAAPAPAAPAAPTQHAVRRAPVAPPDTRPAPVAASPTVSPAPTSPRVAAPPASVPSATPPPAVSRPSAAPAATPAPPAPPPPSSAAATPRPAASARPTAVGAPTSSPAPSSTPAPRTAAPPAVVSREPAPPRDPSPPISREALARLAAPLAGTGTFEAAAVAVGGTPLAAFVGPGLARDAVTTLAARIATLLGGAAGEQVTVRTTHATIVVSAAPTPIVVAVRRPGAPVALLELRAARAAALAGRASDGTAPPSRSLATLAVESRVAGVAETLAAFGTVEPAVLAEGNGGARVYVFREPGREAARVAELALAAWDALGRGHGGESDLGALVSVIFRQGRRRIFVRAVGGRGTVLLAAAGSVARPGRAWRDADRAAAALEAR
jgi:hypothetical protein